MGAVKLYLEDVNKFETFLNLKSKKTIQKQISEDPLRADFVLKIAFKNLRIELENKYR